jgi:histone H3
MQKKTRKFHPGTVAIREIRKQQKSDELALRKAPFERLVRTVTKDFAGEMRFSEKAMRMIQAAMEEHATRLCEDGYKIAIRGGRQTLSGKDISLANAIKTGCH